MRHRQRRGCVAERWRLAGACAIILALAMSSMTPIPAAAADLPGASSVPAIDADLVCRAKVELEALTLLGDGDPGARAHALGEVRGVVELATSSLRSTTADPASSPFVRLAQELTWWLEAEAGGADGSRDQEDALGALLHRGMADAFLSILPGGPCDGSPTLSSGAVLCDAWAVVQPLVVAIEGGSSDPDALGRAVDVVARIPDWSGTDWARQALVEVVVRLSQAVHWRRLGDEERTLVALDVARASLGTARDLIGALRADGSAPCGPTP